MSVVREFAAADEEINFGRTESILEEQNPQLCYCEASKLTKKCVLREPGSSSPMNPP